MQADPEEASALLLGWVRRHADEKAAAWLDEKRRQITEGAPDRVFYAAFSSAPRFMGKADLALTQDDLKRAGEVRSGWRPIGWSVDQAARTALALALPTGDEEAHVRRLEQLFSAADVAEQIALYGALPLLPFPERFHFRATEGLRSSMTPVFNAVALNNPYPADFFDENTWNHMVLKAVFMGERVQDIVGLDRRANPVLARMAVDLAHERWAAGRSFTPQLWRLVGPFADEVMVRDLERALNSEDEAQRQAAALALAASASAEAVAVLARAPDLRGRIEKGRLNWADLH